MVTLKKIKEILKEYKSNLERLKYLNGLLEETEDKELIKDIKLMIKNIRELEAVSQIETRGRVDWSVPENEPEEEKILERQVVGVPLRRIEEGEEKKIEYSLGSTVDLYREGTRGSNIIYEDIKNKEGKSFIEGDSNLIERVEEQYLGKDINKSHEDIMVEVGMRKYELIHEERGYASLSEEIHEKARKKHLH